MCEKCDDLEQKIAYYTELTSGVIDHELANVLEEILRKLQDEKSALHPQQEVRPPR